MNSTNQHIMPKATARQNYSPQCQYDNHLGSASLELDYNANIISYEEYYPFGTTSYRSGRTETEASLKRYKYVGKERDEETGLYYYGARYYAGWLGRWTAVDPRATKYPWYSPFIAMNNNPIYFTDPTGKSGVAYKTNKKNKATGRPILRVKANIYIYGKGANETRKEAIQSEIQTQYNRNEDYFTYTDDGGTIYDVIFEFKTEILENSSVNSKISELKPENNFYEIDEGEDSFTLAGIYGGNTGIFTINDLDQSKGTVSHELNHGFGGEDHPKSPIPLDREIDITLPQNQENTSGDYIDATKRKVTQKNITNILSKVKFNSIGEGTVGFPRPHKANRTELRYEDVRE